MHKATTTEHKTTVEESASISTLTEKATVGKVQKLCYPNMWGPNAHEYRGFWVDESDPRCFASDEEVDTYKRLLHKQRKLSY